MRRFAWCAVYTAARIGEAKSLICVVFSLSKGLDLCRFDPHKGLDLCEAQGNTRNRELTTRNVVLMQRTNYSQFEMPIRFDTLCDMHTMILMQHNRANKRIYTLAHFSKYGKIKARNRLKKYKTV